MNVASLLAKSATTWRDRPAMAIGGSMTETYGEHGERVARLAGALRNRLELQPGDRVGIAMQNAAAYSCVLFAAWHGGFAAVPMNAKLHTREFAFMLDNAGIKLCFVDNKLAPVIAEAADELEGLTIINVQGADFNRLIEAEPIEVANVDPDDLAWLFYTSGTTGQPKGAMLTHRNLMMMTVSYFGDVDPVSEQDSLLHAAPMSHGSGLYILPYVAKGALQVIPESGGFDPAEVFDLLKAHRNVNAFCAPTMVTRLINVPGISSAVTANLKTIIYGGGPMYAEDCLKALDVLGPKLVQIYGQGESPMTITALSRADHMNIHHPRYEDRLASVGTARTDLEVRVTDEDDTPLPPGEIGEVCVRGDVVMKGYWQNAEATAETLRGGWLHTGDIGALDEDGYLTLKDRSKDVIISGGSNIYPREVEEVLLRHESVLEVSVVGVPDEDWGEAVVAFVVSRDGQEIPESELDAMCLAHIARFKRPKSYRFVDLLPKNNYGKILKTELRRMVEG